MFNQLSQFASEEGPHISLKAETLFHIGGINITNSLLYGVVVAITLAIIGSIGARVHGQYAGRHLQRSQKSRKIRSDLRNVFYFYIL